MCQILSFSGCPMKGFIWSMRMQSSIQLNNSWKISLNQHMNSNRINCSLNGTSFIHTNNFRHVLNYTWHVNWWSCTLWLLFIRRNLNNSVNSVQEFHGHKVHYPPYYRKKEVLTRLQIIIIIIIIIIAKILKITECIFR